MVKHDVRLHQNHSQRLAHPMLPKLLKSPSWFTIGRRVQATAALLVIVHTTRLKTSAKT